MVHLWAYFNFSHHLWSHWRKLNWSILREFHFLWRTLTWCLCSRITTRKSLWSTLYRWQCWKMWKNGWSTYVGSKFCQNYLFFCCFFFSKNLSWSEEYLMIVQGHFFISLSKYVVGTHWNCLAEYPWHFYEWWEKIVLELSSDAPEPSAFTGHFSPQNIGFKISCNLSNPIFWEMQEKIFQNTVCWKLYLASRLKLRNFWHMLRLSVLGKNFSRRHFEIFFLFFLRK